MVTTARIGTTIRKARERRRWSQKDLAARLGVSRSAVNAWENDRAYPQSSIGAIEELLAVSLAEQPPAESAITPEDEWERLVYEDQTLRPDEKREIIRRARRLRAELYPGPQAPAAAARENPERAAG